MTAQEPGETSSFRDTRTDWRPRSSRVGIGPMRYVWWNFWYAVLEFLNRRLARDPHRKVSWDKWPSALGLIYLMGKIRFNRSNALTDPYDDATNDTAPASEEPAWARRYYSADGTYVSDQDDPQMGAAGTRFGSNIPPKRVRPDVENIIPSARDAAKLRWRRLDPETGKEITIPALILNSLAAGWIQFNFHNFGGNTLRNSVHVDPHRVPRAPEEGWPNDVALIDRTTPDPTRVALDARPTVINERDQSWSQAQVYGSDERQQHALRTMSGGKMKLDAEGRLPEDPAKAGVDLTGFNNNFNPILSLLHWLAVREHNAIAEFLAELHSDWDDETLFQMARKANVAQLARIHTDQWTRDLLQHETLQIGMHADWYGFLGQPLKMFFMRKMVARPWLDRLLRPVRQNDFLWGMPGSKWDHHDGPYQVPKHFRMVYRLHEMILSEYEISEPETQRTLERIPLLEFVHHNTRPIVAKHGYETLAWSFVSRSAGALTLHNFPRALTKFQNQQDGTLTDLAERDLFRERTDGTGTYNEFRQSLGDPPVESFLELTGGDEELARELSVKYEGDVNRVDAGIGILAEPKPAGFALGFTQFYQFVLNAPRRIKSNRHLSEGYDYRSYLEGMDWVEHGGGMGGILARHLPRLHPSMEGVERWFAPWPDVETFPYRLLAQAENETARIFRAELLTGLLACGAFAWAAWWDVLVSWQPPVLFVATLTGISLSLVAMRMLAMRFLQQCWKRCYTDKRVYMFGSLSRADRWSARITWAGRLETLAVFGGAAAIYFGAERSHPLVAAAMTLFLLAAASIWRRSNQFNRTILLLMISLRNRMRTGRCAERSESRPNEAERERCFEFVRRRLDASLILAAEISTVNPLGLAAGRFDERQFDRQFRRFAPGRDSMTAYDFARLRESCPAFQGIAGLWTRWAAQRQTRALLRYLGDRVIEEDHRLVPAISRGELLRFYQGTALFDVFREHETGACDPGANANHGFGWREWHLGGSESAEERLLKQFADEIHALQDATARRQDGRVRRGFHAKGILCVPEALFQVAPVLPEGCAVGPFQPKATFAAQVRFSNSLGTIEPDGKSQGRGIAIRLLGDRGVHDLLLSNSPTSHARDAGQFMALAFALSGASKLMILPRVVRRVGFWETLRMFRVLYSTSSRKVPSLAAETFWSRTPYSLGGRAVRFVLKPTSAAERPPTLRPDYLREDLVRRLQSDSIEYELFAQLYVDERLTPLEDGSIDWREVDSPPLSLGTLVIPAQDLTSEVAQTRIRDVEQTEFNPWNVIGDVRPLGSLNRARRVVYRASAEHRRKDEAPIGKRSGADRF